jgi:hypothetical protein
MALLGVVAPDALEDGGAVTDDVGKNMQRSVFPVDPFSVVPNFLGLLNGHGRFLSRRARGGAMLEI